jgi:hypothetical protein
VHLHEAGTLERSLAPGAVGTVLLLLLQFGYLPNAIVWAIAFSLGPGFAFGSATVVAPTGSALGRLPALPLLAALPPGVHSALPGGLEPVVLALPYVAGGLGGLLLVRAAPALGLDTAPMLGLVCGAVSGGVLALLAAVSGGPLGDGRLAAVGPSPWQVGVVSALELGISMAVAAGVLNYLALRRTGALPKQPGPPAPDPTEPDIGAHVIYLDSRTSDVTSAPGKPPGPAALS